MGMVGASLPHTNELQVWAINTWRSTEAKASSGISSSAVAELEEAGWVLNTDMDGTEITVYSMKIKVSKEGLN